MKDDSSLAGKIVNRNWVLKRKRRKLPYGSDFSNGKEDHSTDLEPLRISASAKHRLEEVCPELSPSKKKGHDGVSYFYHAFP